MHLSFVGMMLYSPCLEQRHSIFLSIVAPSMRCRAQTKINFKVRDDDSLIVCLLIGKSLLALCQPYNAAIQRKRWRGPMGTHPPDCRCLYLLVPIDPVFSLQTWVLEFFP